MPVIESIVTYTNIEMLRRRDKYNDNQRYLQDTDSVEILGLIGLLYTAGFQKDGHLTVDEMWSHLGPQFYRCVMSDE